MTTSVRAEDWIDLHQTAQADLFESVDQLWKVIPALSEYIRERIERPMIDPTALIHPTATVGRHVQIGAGTVIGPYAVIEDNVLIGANCHLGKACYIRAHTIVGDDCVIGHATEVKRSILCNHVSAPHFNYIGDSIIGYRVHLGGGAMIANFKGDGSNITLAIENERYETNLRKFGAIIGDECEIGTGAILNPGTCIGRRSTIYPGSIIRGYIPANKIYKHKMTDIEIVDRQ